MLEEAYSLGMWDSDARRSAELAARATSIIDNKAVGHAYGKDDRPLPPLGPGLQAFEHWSSVASTLHTKLYKISGYDPSTTEYSEDLFARLRNSFSTSPFWNIQFSIVMQEVTVGHSSYRPAVEAIRDSCRRIEIAPEICEQITGNFGQILSLALKPDWVPQKRTLLQNATIAITKGVLHLALIYAIVGIEITSEAPEYRVSDQSIQLVFGQGVLDYDFCKRHANRILAYDHVSISDWKVMAAANLESETMCNHVP
jgi:hypothetical protein